MTDRELLELAARAAGIPCKGWVEPGLRRDGWHGIYTGSDEDGAYVKWNPLLDPADALRLAVMLEIEIAYFGPGTISPYWRVVASDKRSTFYTAEPRGTDPLAATCRAIVRAAAEIGKWIKP